MSMLQQEFCFTHCSSAPVCPPLPATLPTIKLDLPASSSMVNTRKPQQWICPSATVTKDDLNLCVCSAEALIFRLPCMSNNSRSACWLQGHEEVQNVAHFKATPVVLTSRAQRTLSILRYDLSVSASKSRWMGSRLTKGLRAASRPSVCKQPVPSYNCVKSDMSCCKSAHQESNKFGAPNMYVSEWVAKNK